MEESAELYWQRFETETGEKVIAKTMGQCFTSAKDRGDWGLAILTEKHFFFRKIAGQNWLSGLFKASSTGKEPERIEDMVFALSEISGIGEPRRSLFDRIFGTPFSVFTIKRFSEPEGEPLRFSVDPKGGFLQALQDSLRSDAFPPDGSKA
ncbi:MAG: hypothetical protein WAZ99_01685 [Rectinemataceae bacterium]